jgi:hypothetical protein
MASCGFASPARRSGQALAMPKKRGAEIELSDVAHLAWRTQQNKGEVMAQLALLSDDEAVKLLELAQQILSSFPALKEDAKHLARAIVESRKFSPSFSAEAANRESAATLPKLPIVREPPKRRNLISVGKRRFEMLETDQRNRSPFGQFFSTPKRKK